MKKSIGNESQKATREARKLQRANRAACGGMGVPCSELARVQIISRFCKRQTPPQTLINIRKPSPPPTLMDRCALKTSAPLFRSRMRHEAAITMVAIAMVRNQGL